MLVWSGTITVRRRDLMMGGLGAPGPVKDARRRLDALRRQPASTEAHAEVLGDAVAEAELEFLLAVMRAKVWSWLRGVE